MTQDRLMWKGEATQLRQDNLNVNVEVHQLHTLTGLPTSSKLERVIVSEGRIIHAVSDRYALLRNESFFDKMGDKLNDAGLGHVCRSINRDNRSFSREYILTDESVKIEVKNGDDEILPMIRLTNSYDGSSLTRGTFGFFRKVCQNGLHVAHQEIGFKVRHVGEIAEVVMPEMDKLLKLFIDNEYYTLRRTFEVLADRAITDQTELKRIVRETCMATKVFMYEASEQNPEPSANARAVIDMVNREASLLNSEANQWLVYNAFNSIVHNKLQRTFQAQENLDSKIFNHFLN